MTLVGIAKDAKGGAVLVVNDMPIYIKGMSLWSPDLFNKSIKVKGILRKEKMIPDPFTDENGGISQGSIGKQYILENADLLK
ncbi:MAG: hypothetical protein ACFFBP_07605 [Promethearchaeota archaeon]